MTAATRSNQRDHILDVALRLMSTHGSAAMSMRLLARECGLGVAALYHYFESKDALLAAVVDERRYGDRMAEPPDVDLAGSAEQRLRAMFAEMWRGAIEEEAIWRLLLGEGVRGEPTVLPVGQALLETVERGLSAWIEAVLPEVDDAGAGARIMIGQLFGGFVRHIFDPGLPLSDIEAQAADALVAAMVR